MRLHSPLFGAAILVALLAAGGGRAREATPTGACVEASTLGNWYSFESASNKIFVTGTINDSRPLRFVIDTGAPSGFIDDALVEALGFSRQSSSRGAGAAGASQVVLTRLGPPVCVAAAGAVLANARIGALRLSEISEAEGLRVDGLIGGDFFNQHMVEVDYAQKRIRMLPATFEYSGSAVPVPVSVESGHIYATATVTTASGESVKGKFLIDTGFRTAISFTGPFAAEYHLTNGVPRIVEVTMGIGAGGESRATIFRLAGLRLGDLEWRDVVATASLDKAGLLARSDLAGVIGGDLMRRYKLFLDYPHHRLFFESMGTINQTFDYDESGTFLTAPGPDFRTPRVLHIVSGSPAAEAGIHEGDVIEAIDGTATSALGLEQVRALFRVDRKSYKLVLRRNGNKVATTLQTRSLFSSGPSRNSQATSGATPSSHQ